MTPPAYHDIASLIDTIRRERAAFTRHWYALTDAHMTAVPAVQADWSVKDLLMHLLWWENFAMMRLMLLSAAEPFVPLIGYDAINAQILTQSQARTLSAVQQDFNANMERIASFLAAQSWEQLNAPIVGEWGTFSPLELIAGNTYEHYQEHLPDLLAYLKTL